MGSRGELKSPLAVSNPRRVGLDEIVMEVLGVAGTLPQVEVQRPNAARDEPAKRLHWRTKAQCRSVCQGEKDATEERSVFLAKLGVGLSVSAIVRCSTTHSLRATGIDFISLKYRKRIRCITCAKVMQNSFSARWHQPILARTVSTKLN